MAGAPPIALHLAREVLIVKPSSLGDIVHTLPAVHALKAAYPGVNFHWVANQEWCPLLAGNPDLASVLPFPRKKLKGMISAPGFLRWCRDTRTQIPGGFDAAIDFQGLLRSVLIAKGLGAKKIAGLSDAREGSRLFFDNVCDVKDCLHAVDRYLHLAAMLGARIDSPTFPLPLGEVIEGVDPCLLLNSVLLHPFSRGEGKSLPVPLIEATINALAPRTVILVGMGGPPGYAWPGNTLNLLHQTSLTQLLWLLRHCVAAVSVDSGPMHLAAALPIPLLGLHTWSDPRKVGPCRSNASVWKAGRIVQVSTLERQPNDWCVSAGAWENSLPDSIGGWVSSI